MGSPGARRMVESRQVPYEFLRAPGELGFSPSGVFGLSPPRRTGGAFGH